MRATFFTLLKKPFFGRFRVPWKDPRNEHEKKGWERMSVRSQSGATISLLWRAQPNAQGTVVLGHPMGKAAKGVFLKNGHADRLLQAGFNVLLYDMNGFGESGMGNFGYYKDVAVVGQKARELSGDLPIGYHGISLGGMWVTPVLSSPDNPFQHVILESASTSLPEFWIHYPLAYKLLRFSFFFTPKLAEYLKPINHISQLNKVESLLLIYSDSDIYTPLEMGERLQNSASIKAALWNASGAEHALAFKSHGEEYMEKVVGFFQTQMKKA